MSESAFANNTNNVILKENNIPPKSRWLIIALAIGLIVITVALVIILYFSVGRKKHKSIRRSRPFHPNRTDVLEKDNSITANYVINQGDTDTLLFHPSFIDLIETIKVNENISNITNILTFENSGSHKV